MRIGNKTYTRAEALERVGSIRQLGGMRRCVLDEGRTKGVSALDVDTGAGFRFTVLPDRGLDLSSASFRGTNLVHLTQNGEAHPAFYEPQGLGWLRTFFAGLLATCGLTHLGPPGPDGEDDLGLHGRATVTPARQVCDLSRWEGDEYLMEITGVVEESMLFGDKIRLTRTISTRIGSRSLTIRDVAENFGYATSPFHILYHVNAGFPLLDACSRLVLSECESEPCDAQSARGMEKLRAFSAPIPAFPEENFLHRMRPGADGMAVAAMVNPELEGGLGLYVRFDARTLPLLNEWKMMGQGDYVVGIEPCNAPCENRGVLRRQGLLPFLEPGETREMTVEIGVVQGAEEIEALAKCNA